MKNATYKTMTKVISFPGHLAFMITRATGDTFLSIASDGWKRISRDDAAKVIRAYRKAIRDLDLGVVRA